LTLDVEALYIMPMCNLYSLTPKEDDVGRFFRVSHNRRPAFKPVNASFPPPVVRLSRTPRMPAWPIASRSCSEVLSSITATPRGVGPIRLHAVERR
jgi:hypothetical protein